MIEVKTRETQQSIENTRKQSSGVGGRRRVAGEAWRLILKRKQNTRSHPYGFRFSLFPGKLFVSHETIFFLHKFSHSRAFINHRMRLLVQFL